MTRFFLKTQAESGPSRQMAKAAMCLLAESVRDKEILERLDLTITEAFANVVRHAYKEDEPGRHRSRSLPVPANPCRG